ncbi:tetratricopeptide (TPR) repeat protein [Chitinophaga sp. W2I13]|uniref:SIR2 family protein n=1 Tax=Chitinophaga sp. W2I13 TaxID=3373923 RepID=UPI003D1D2162
MDKRLLKAIRSNKAIVLAGAGVSIATTNDPLSSWNGLLRHGVMTCKNHFSDKPDEKWIERRYRDLEEGDVYDKLNVATQVMDRFGKLGKELFEAWLERTIGKLTVKDRKLIDAIGGLKLPILTTNFDTLIEKVLGRDSVIWENPELCSQIIKGKSPAVLHVHGCWKHPETIVLDLKSYGRIGADDFIQTFLKSIEYHHSIIFMGFGAGIDDPNFQGFLNWAKGKFLNSQTQHFILVRAGEEPKDLPDNIIPIVYGESYEDLPGFLQQLVAKNRRPGRPRKNAKYFNFSPVPVANNVEEPVKNAWAHKLVSGGAGNKIPASEGNVRPVMQSAEGFLEYASSNMELVKDVMFLSMLLQIDEKVLALYWPGIDVTQKLNELSSQHPFISNGRVGASDRKLFRHNWEKGHNPIAQEVLTRLDKIIETLRVDVNFKTNDYFNWYLQFLNVKCWTSGVAVIPHLVKGLLAGVLTGKNCQVIMELAMEVVEFHPDEKSFAGFLENRSFTDLESLQLKWVDLCFLESLYIAEWYPMERAILYFVLAYGYYVIKDSRMALYYFDMAFAVSDNFLPEVELLAKAYLDVVLAVLPIADSLMMLNNCLQWIDKFNLSSSGLYRELAMVYHHAKEYEKAVSLWKKYLELEPTHVTTYEELITTLTFRMGEHEAAITVFKEAPVSIRDRPLLKLLISGCYQRLKNYTQAVKYYRMVIDHDYDAKGAVYCLLAELYVNNLNDPDLAEDCFVMAIREKGSNYETLCCKLSYLQFLMDTDQPEKATSLVLLMEQLLNEGYHRLSADVLNNAAWHLYLLNLKLDLAEKISSRAVELEDNPELYVHTLSCILVRRNKWIEAKRHILKWVAYTNDDVVKDRWDDYLPLFRDAVIANKQTMVERLLKEENSRLWIIIRYALLKTTIKGRASVIPESIISQVEVVYQQLISKESPGEFPS